MEKYKVIIIGSGPAAHTAAIYAARADLKPLMFEGFMAGGVASGGQLTTTTDIDNFPGFPEGISGPELMDNMRKQSLRFGTLIKTETVEKVSLGTKPFKVYTSSGTYLADSLIIATGATAKRLNLPHEVQLWQKGISACAVCDGALPLFRNQDVIVVGGGDTACEEASFMTKFAKKVYVAVRRDILRASVSMQKKLLDDPKIEILWNTEVLDCIGHDNLTAVKIFNNKTKEEKELEVKGLFYAIGHLPNTAFLEQQLKTNATGYIIAKNTKTNIEGVFACGDVQDPVYRQAITSAGSGCIAAMEAIHFLENLKK